MSDLSIKVEHLGKRYRIGVEEEKHETLSGMISSWAKAPLKNFRELRKLSRFDDENESDIIWALRDVSFEVKKGEVVGLIGHNGSGKSTLLKILSRITEPTLGYADLNGRVASLLEVGTGFHPELTGRENVYLNGTILGMKKAEIDRKFDEIVAFSEVDKFIDTPVKRYSSGMKVRLGFAVAAHLEPEILLVDEVLAVGDVSFQRKCLGKMEDVAGEGRTVIFVSHHMSMIQALCTRGIVLKGGGVMYDGTVDQAMGEYLRQLESTAANPFENNPNRTGNQAVRFTGIRMRDGDGNATDHLIAGKPVTIELDYENIHNVKEADLTFTIYNNLGIPITSVNFNLTNFVVDTLHRHGTFKCYVPSLPLVPGQYRIAAALRADGAAADHIPNAFVFYVDTSTFYSSGRTPTSKYATFMLDHEWEHVGAEWGQQDVELSRSLCV